MTFLEICIIPVLPNPEALEDPCGPFWSHNVQTQNCTEVKNVAVMWTAWGDIGDMLLTVDK